MTNEVRGYKLTDDGKEIAVTFWYKESCHNVYKSTWYYVDGKQVRGNKKEIKELLATAPSIMTANCYFWKPAMNASQRRSNEERRVMEVKEWLESQGFEITYVG